MTKRAVLAVVTAIVLAALVVVPLASAEALAPWWGVTSGSRPTNLIPGQPGRIVVTAQNRGDAPTSGEVTISDALPAGLQATAIEGVAGQREGSENRGPVSCELTTLTCTFSGSLHPYEQIEIEIAVSVDASAASGERNTASVSGGGVSGTATASHAIEVDGTEKFGVEDYELIPENADGSVDTQAGSHPFQLTTIVTPNSTTPDAQGRPRTFGLAKNIVAELPAGFVADPTPLTQCSEAQFARQAADQSHGIANECPAQSAVGVATMTFNEPQTYGFLTVTTPIFNMTPLAGEPARFGFKPLGIIPAYLDASVRSGGDYGVTLTASDLPELVSLLSVKLTFWGVPGDPRHDGERGWECLKGFGSCPPSTATSPPPFLVMPTSCETPFQSTIRGESWGSSARAAEQAEPVTYSLRGGSGEAPDGDGEPLSLDGCDQLPFAASVGVSPAVSSASTPTGLTVDLHVAQTVEPTPESLAESSARDITLALPAGVTLNPAGANGLEACSESQIGLDNAEKPSCPDASKLGTVKLQTPILPNPLEGAVYLAAENANPFGALAAIYLLARDRVSGTLVKLAGNLSLNQATGQITVTFESTPQLPFEDIELSFFGGERGLLATPARCGSYTTQASFTPWSGGESVSSRSSFQITAGADITAGEDGGAGGSPCPGASLPFAPSLAAGTTTNEAGAFGPLTVTLGREDGEQALGGFDLRLPQGLEGMLSSVALCPEAQANAGTCSSASQIGETTVSAGLGNDPYTIEGGRVYLTGPYDGTGPCTPGQLSPGTQSSGCAPFGLAIVTPVKAGPLDLENAPENHPACDCLVIRARIEVNPQTAQLTIVSATIPHIIDGVPLQIKHLNITIDRKGFIFNSTNCNKMKIESEVTGDEGANAQVSSSFQLANCASLKFSPKLTVSTSGKTSPAKGASLAFKLAYPRATQGEEANIGAVKIDLPKQLPSRLTTLQQACLAKTFAANPAACPAASVIGRASISTPILPTPVCVKASCPGGGGGSGGNLIGPAYFVSHGGAAFPSLEIVLQGDGVRIDLVGTTSISNKRITSVTFRTIPDVPVSTFTLTLPEGPYSALGTNKSLCKLKGKLRMPTALTGQNGATIHVSTKVGVSGCPSTRPPAHKKAATRKKGTRTAK